MLSLERRLRGWTPIAFHGGHEAVIDWADLREQAFDRPFFSHTLKAWSTGSNDAIVQSGLSTLASLDSEPSLDPDVIIRSPVAVRIDVAFAADGRNARTIGACWRARDRFSASSGQFAAPARGAGSNLATLDPGARSQALWYRAALCRQTFKSGQPFPCAVPSGVSQDPDRLGAAGAGRDRRIKPQETAPCPCRVGSGNGRPAGATRCVLGISRGEWLRRCQFSRCRLSRLALRSMDPCSAAYTGADRSRLLVADAQREWLAFA